MSVAKREPTALEKLDSMLEDEAAEGVSYVKTAKGSIEVSLSKEKKDTCRDIVREIRNFGISQRQMVFLIELLALELENREVMLAIKSAVTENREKVPVARIILSD